MSTQGDMGKMKIGGEVEGERESTYWRQVVPPKQEFNVAEEEEGQGGTQIAPPPKLKRKRNLPGRPDPNSEVIELSPKQLTAKSNFTCEVCNRGFLRHQNLQLHRRGHNLPWQLHNPSTLPPRKKVFVCPVETCVYHHPSRALGDLSGIKKHFVRKHGEKIWKCNKCEKRYAVKADLVTHSTTCGSQRYKCVCGIFFSKRENFMTHQIYCIMSSEGKEEQASNSNAPADPMVGDAPPIQCICGIPFSSMETLDLHSLFCYKTITESFKINTSESTTHLLDDNFGNQIPKIGHPSQESSSKRDVSSLPMKMEHTSILLDDITPSEMNFMPINSAATKEVACPIGRKNMQADGDELGSMSQMGFQKLLDQANPTVGGGLENLLELDNFCKDIGNIEDSNLAEDDSVIVGGGGVEVHDIYPPSVFNDYPWMDNGGLGLDTTSDHNLDENNIHWFNFSVTTGFGPTSFDSIPPPRQ